MENIITILFLSLRVLMAALLYLFMSWAILVMWRTLKRESFTVNSTKIPALRLNFIGEEFSDQTIERPQFSIGRSPSNECRIEHKTVSARHALFSYHHSQWWIEDAGSKNGTYLNEQAVREETIITGKDTLRCGHVEFTIEIEKR